MITTQTLIQYTRQHPAALKLPLWLYAKRPTLHAHYKGEFPPEWEHLYIKYTPYGGSSHSNSGWTVQIPEPSSLVWSEQSIQRYHLNEFHFTVGKTARHYLIDLPNGTIPGAVFYEYRLYVVEFTMNFVG